MKEIIRIRDAIREYEASCRDETGKFDGTKWTAAIKKAKMEKADYLCDKYYYNLINNIGQWDNFEIKKLGFNYTLPNNERLIPNRQRIVYIEFLFNNEKYFYDECLKTKEDVFSLIKTSVNLWNTGELVYNIYFSVASESYYSGDKIERSRSSYSGVIKTIPWNAIDDGTRSFVMSKLDRTEKALLNDTHMSNDIRIINIDYMRNLISKKEDK